jgi:hypothetical protein
MRQGERKPKRATDLRSQRFERSVATRGRQCRPVTARIAIRRYRLFDVRLVVSGTWCAAR